MESWELCWITIDSLSKKDLDNLTALVLAAAFVMLSFIKEEEICINTDLGHSSMVWSACSSGKFKTPCKSKPLDQARHTFNSSSTEFLQALDMSPSYSLSDRCRGFCNPFEPRKGVQFFYGCSQMLSTLTFFPQAQNVSTKKKQKKKKGWWIHLVCVIYLLSLPNMKYSEWRGKKTKQNGEAAPGNADA